jgi:hypothetical protein
VAGIPFTVLGAEKDSPINIYNLYGACVGSVMGTEGITKLSLDLSAGIYFIRSNHKQAKIIILK